jgi:hypothetical protein
MAHARPVIPTALGLILLAALLIGCSEDSSSPLSPEEERLVGSWRLDLGEVDADELALVYAFRRDHSATSSIGGAFLRRLREIDALADAELGQLQDLEQIDGSDLLWRGTWTLQDDSLRVHFDELQIDVRGNLPVLGSIAVPVYLQSLDTEQQPEVAYTYQVSGDRLVLRGAAAGAGIVSATMGEQSENLDPLARQAIIVAAEVLAETFQQSDANQFVYLRQ